MGTSWLGTRPVGPMCHVSTNTLDLDYFEIDPYVCFCLQCKSPFLCLKNLGFLLKIRIYFMPRPNLFLNLKSHFRISCLKIWIEGLSETMVSLPPFRWYIWWKWQGEKTTLHTPMRFKDCRTFSLLNKVRPGREIFTSNNKEVSSVKMFRSRQSCGLDIEDNRRSLSDSYFNFFPPPPPPHTHPF